MNTKCADTAIQSHKPPVHPRANGNLRMWVQFLDSDGDLASSEIFISRATPASAQARRRERPCHRAAG